MYENGSNSKNTTEKALLIRRFIIENFQHYKEFTPHQVTQSLPAEYWISDSDSGSSGMLATWARSGFPVDGWRVRQSKVGSRYRYRLYRIDEPINQPAQEERAQEPSAKETAEVEILKRKDDGSVMILIDRQPFVARPLDW